MKALNVRVATLILGLVLGLAVQSQKAYAGHAAADPEPSVSPTKAGPREEAAVKSEFKEFSERLKEDGKDGIEKVLRLKSPDPAPAAPAPPITADELNISKANVKKLAAYYDLLDNYLASLKACVEKPGKSDDASTGLVALMEHLFITKIGVAVTSALEREPTPATAPGAVPAAPTLSPAPESVLDEKDTYDLTEEFRGTLEVRIKQLEKGKRDASAEKILLKKLDDVRKALELKNGSIKIKVSYRSGVYKADRTVDTGEKAETRNLGNESRTDDKEWAKDACTGSVTPPKKDDPSPARSDDKKKEETEKKKKTEKTDDGKTDKAIVESARSGGENAQAKAPGGPGQGGNTPNPSPPYGPTPPFGTPLDPGVAQVNPNANFDPNALLRALEEQPNLNLRRDGDRAGGDRSNTAAPLPQIPPFTATPPQPANTGNQNGLAQPQQSPQMPMGMNMPSPPASPSPSASPVSDNKAALTDLQRQLDKMQAKDDALAAANKDSKNNNQMDPLLAALLRGQQGQQQNGPRVPTVGGALTGMASAGNGGGRLNATNSRFNQAPNLQTAAIPRRRTVAPGLAAVGMGPTAIQNFQGTGSNFQIMNNAGQVPLRNSPTSAAYRGSLGGI